MAAPSPTDPAIARVWLVRLRWASVLAQVAAVVFANGALHAPIPNGPVAAVILAALASNLLLNRTTRRAAIPAAVLLDLVLLTILLALTGGASNPFSVLYLLHVALAAVLLGPGWTWIVAGLAILGFASLFPFTAAHPMHAATMNVEAHLWGMWVAFAVTSVGIAWFVARLASALRAREDELARLRRDAERKERIVSLATLAAGAAHELGSPLSAIAVSAREIALLAAELPDGTILDEARAVRSQVERCRDIVGRLTRQAGAAQVEAPVRIAIRALWEEIGQGLPERDAARIAWDAESDLQIMAPTRALADALGSLLRNALQAGPGQIRVRAAAQAGMVRFWVEDEGAGMTAEVMSRAGEPFFTTRPAGQGMGLGVFLARRFAEGLGGELTLASREGRGTQITLSIPAPGGGAP